MNKKSLLPLLVSAVLSLAANATPDWSKSDHILPSNSRGKSALQLAEKQNRLAEVARRNGLSVDELKKELGRDNDLGLDKAGFLNFVCEGLVASDALTATGHEAYSAVPNSTDAFKLHSLPGSTRVIYLDFTGHTTSGTGWNSSYTAGADIVSTPLDTDGDNTTFSTAECDLIKRIWARVAEDFAPFAVDVTTEDPGLEALRKTSGSDNAYGIRVVISPTNAWYPNAGGVAYVGSFSASTDTPCFIFTTKLGPNNEKYVADAISHETGHTLGLSHDGKTDGTAYFQGHGNWAPIMGVSYYKTVTQWSKGEYALANNTQDDLVVMAGNGAPIAFDDNGDTISSATPLSGASISTAGVVEHKSDADVFSFSTGAGTISLSVTGSSNQPDLDAVLELLDGQGQVIASSNPSTLNASLSLSVPAGTYYARISGTGYLDPVSTGYSNYASLGEYVLQGTLVAITAQQVPVAVASASVTAGPAPLSVQFSSQGSTDPDGVISSYLWNFGDGTSSTEANPAHSYTVAGSFPVTLSVRDNDGFVTCSDAIVISTVQAVNQAPVASATASVSSGYGPLSVSFSSLGSSDADGSIASYLWNFGDGTTSSLANPSKTFAVGSYNVTLTVTDNQGAQSSKSLAITVSQNPDQLYDLNSFVMSKASTKSGTVVTATLRVLDRLGRPVAGVKVNANWSGLQTGAASVSTDAQGYAKFTSKAFKRGGTVGLSVASFSNAANYAYDAGLYTELLSKSLTF